MVKVWCARYKWCLFESSFFSLGYDKDHTKPDGTVVVVVGLLTYRVEATGSEAPEFLHNYDMIDRRHCLITLFVPQPRRQTAVLCCAVRHAELP